MRCLFTAVGSVCAQPAPVAWSSSSHSLNPIANNRARNNIKRSQGGKPCNRLLYSRFQKFPWQAGGDAGSGQCSFAQVLRNSLSEHRRCPATRYSAETEKAKRLFAIGFSEGEDELQATGAGCAHTDPTAVNKHRIFYDGKSEPGTAKLS